MISTPPLQPSPFTDRIHSLLVYRNLSRNDPLPLWITKPPSQDHVDDARKLARLYASRDFRRILERLVSNKLTNHQVASALLVTNKQYMEVFFRTLLSRIIYVTEALDIETVSGLQHAYNTILEMSQNMLPAYVVYYNNEKLLSERETVRFFEEFGERFALLNDLIEPVYLAYEKNKNNITDIID